MFIVRLAGDGCYLAVAGEDLFCAVLFPTKSGTELSQYLRIFLPTLDVWNSFGEENTCIIHGGESRDILHLYSDRTGKNIRHYFFYTQ